MIWGFLFTIPIIVVTHKLMSYFYPERMRKLTRKTGWNTLELCSRAEIYISKFYNKIKYYLPNILSPNITFINDGDEILNYSLSEYITIQKNQENTLKYDFVLYEVNIITMDNYSKYDKYTIRYDSENDIMPFEYKDSENTLDLNMIQLTFKETMTPYKIDFGRNNFNISGNILFDRKFLKWYMKINYSIVLDDSDEYIITFIDHNMNYITLQNDCYIVIDKNNYKIINNVSKAK